MTSRLVVPAGTEDSADSSSENQLMPFGCVLGYSCPRLSREEGTFTESLRNPEGPDFVFLSDRNKWGVVEVKESRSIGQTDSRPNIRGIWGSLEVNTSGPFELAIHKELRSGWIAHIFGQDDDTSGMVNWIVQSSEFQPPTPKRPASDALGALEQISPSDKNDLEDLLKLPLNWDREGGLPATKLAVIEAARLIVELYTKSQRKLDVTSLTAAIDGGVEFTLEGLDGRGLFLVIPSSGTDVRFVVSLPTVSGSYEDTAGFLGSDRSLESLINDLVELS